MAISATLNDQNGILLRYQIFQEYMEYMGCMEYYWTIHIHMWICVVYNIDMNIASILIWMEDYWDIGLDYQWDTSIRLLLE